MRWDIRIANHYYAAAACVAVCVMAAPLAFHLEGVIAQIMFWVSLAGALAFTIAGFMASLRGEHKNSNRGHLRRMVSLCGMVICGVGFIGFSASYFWPSSRSNSENLVEKESRNPLTMRELFDSDFSDAGKVFTRITFNSIPPGQSFVMPATMYYDFFGNSKFLAFYLNKDWALPDAANLIANNLDSVLHTFKSIAKISSKEPGNTQPYDTDNMTFGKIIYIYSEEDSTYAEKNQAEQQFQQSGIKIIFRDSAYQALHQNEHDRVAIGANTPVDMSKVPVVGSVVSNKGNSTSHSVEPRLSPTKPTQP